MFSEMMQLDGEDGTINTRLARRDIDVMFFSPDQSLSKQAVFDHHKPIDHSAKQPASMGFSIFEDPETDQDQHKSTTRNDKVLQRAVHRPFGVKVEEISAVKDLSCIIKETSHEYSMFGCISTPSADDISYHRTGDRGRRGGRVTRLSDDPTLVEDGWSKRNSGNSSYISSDSDRMSNPTKLPAPLDDDDYCGVMND
jgi:hypothetical protein